MKKILAILTALCMVLSVGSTAFAEVKVDGVPQETTQVTHEDDANYVSADASGDVLMVHGDVTGENAGGNDSVLASNGAVITVTGTVASEANLASAISAQNGATVTTGDVTASNNSSGIFAWDATVTTGDISESGENIAVRAYGGEVTTGNISEDGEGVAIEASNGTVTVEGNVDEEDVGNAINAAGSDVLVNGNVTESGDGDAIYATESATVKVGGNVSQSDGGVAIKVSNGATIIVEGSVTGFIDAQTSAADCVYIGQLQNGMITTYDGNNVHYLIGLAADSELTFEDVSMSGDDIIDPLKTVEGLEKSYLYTKTVDNNVLVGKSVTLKPSAEGKALSVSGLDNAKVDCVPNADGTVTLTIQSDFKGGLQNLLLILKDIAKQNPEVAAEIYVSAAEDYSDYVYVPEYSVATTNAELAVAAEELEEGAVKPFNLNNHTGVTLAPSVLGGTEFYTIKVLKDSSELSAGNYSFQMHHDGSVSLILSNTYLLSLENGTYDFTIMVNGQEIVFTVVVNQ